MISTPVATRERRARKISTADAAAFLLGQLQRHRLEVGLATAPVRKHTTHRVRVVESRNPTWYRDLCAQYITRRSRPRRRQARFVDTLIKRRQVLRALYQISRGGALTMYAQRVLPYVEACAVWLQDPNHRSTWFEEE